MQHTYLILEWQFQLASNESADLFPNGSSKKHVHQLEKFQIIILLLAHFTEYI